jgi:hypothetical protein
VTDTGPESDSGLRLLPLLKCIPGSDRNLFSYKKAVVVGSGSVTTCTDRDLDPTFLFDGFQDKIKKLKYRFASFDKVPDPHKIKAGIGIRQQGDSQIASM